MKELMLFLILLILPGCASLSNIIAFGADVNDNGVQQSIDNLCGVYSFGAIKRKFNTKEKAKNLASLCSINKDSELIPSILGVD